MIEKWIPQADHVNPLITLLVERMLMPKHIRVTARPVLMLHLILLLKHKHKNIDAKAGSSSVTELILKR